MLLPPYFWTTTPRAGRAESLSLVLMGRSGVPVP